MAQKIVLFIEPPVDYVNPRVNIGCNLGINSIISYVKKNCDVRVEFYSFEYAKVLHSVLSMEQVLDKYKPDIICLTILTHAVVFAKKFSYLAKNRGCVVIWGGVYVTYNAQRLAQEDRNIDFLIVGEGENVLPYVLNGLQSNKFILGFKAYIVSCHDEDIDELSYCLPDFSLIPDDLINIHNLRATFELTKGCSYKCKFCCVRNISNNSKVKSIEIIRKELKNIANYKFKKTLICDNNFIPGNNQFKEFINAKREICPNMKFRITVRADLITEELLDKYKQIGINELIMGVEHVDPDILKSMQKTKDPTNWKKTIKKAVLLAAKYNFLVHPIFMFGWPGETKSSLKYNCEMACELGMNTNVEPFVAFLTPHPGSETEKFVEKGQVRLITSDLSKYIHLYPVSIPLSYGKGAVEDFIDVHNKIRTISNMTYRNPCIDLEYVYKYADLL
ncbi:radical SAM protein [Lachnospiraceae bacterium 42-17]